MKIKLSKSQWQEIGKKAGWMKVAQIIPDDGIADGGEPYTNEEMDLREEGPFFVSTYEVARAFGGPEEGGWWYNVTTKVKSFKVTSYQQAEKAAKVLYNEINQGDLDGKPTIRLERQAGIMDNSKQPPPHYS